jgi:hypothetical protein
VIRDHSGYCEWLVKSGVHLQKPSLAEALQHHGFLSTASTSAVVEHSGLAVAVFTPAERQALAFKTSRSKRKLKNLLQPHNCSLCGAMDHNAKGSLCTARINCQLWKTANEQTGPFVQVCRSLWVFVFVSGGLGGEGAGKHLPAEATDFWVATWFVVG